MPESTHEQYPAQNCPPNCSITLPLSPTLPLPLSPLSPLSLPSLPSLALTLHFTLFSCSLPLLPLLLIIPIFVSTPPSASTDPQLTTVRAKRTRRQSNWDSDLIRCCSSFLRFHKNYCLFCTCMPAESAIMSYRMYSTACTHRQQLGHLLFCAPPLPPPPPQFQSFQSNPALPFSFSSTLYLYTHKIPSAEDNIVTFTRPTIRHFCSAAVM